DNASVDQALLKQLNAIGIAATWSAAGGGVPVQPRYLRLDHERSALGAAVFHGALNAEPARQRIISVHDLALDAERFAAIDDVLEAMLSAVLGRNAPAVVHDDHRHGELVSGARAPDHAGGEVAFGGAGVAADDKGDGVAAVTLLHEGRARRHRELHLDHGADRHDVP